MQINILQVYFKLILFLVSVARHTQSTHNNKFAIPLQYLKKELNDEVEILIIVVRHVQSTQNNNFAMSWQYLKKKIIKLVVCMQINIKVPKITSLQFLWNVDEDEDKH